MPRPLPDIGAVLADHGLRPGPAGYPWADLAALAESCRWHYRVEPGERGPRRRYRALVWWQTARPCYGRQSARGWGPTEEDALAMALAVALRGAARAPPRPRPADRVPRCPATTDPTTR